MKSRIILALLASASVFGVSAQAQTKDTTNHALRFESSWGNADIIRGPDGPVVGTVGWFRDFDVPKLVESSPHAVAEAKNFQTNNFRGSLVSTLGAATMTIGIVVSANSSNNAASPILIIGGAGAIGWGLQHINRGYAALSKALWWYNHDQAR